MALDFPASPTVGQVFPTSGYPQWKWNGSIWDAVPATSGVDTLSTAETPTNKRWIDGRIIYRKVINVGALPNTATKSTAHGLPSGFMLTDITGVTWQGGTGLHLPLPYTDPSVVSGGIALLTDSTNVNVVTGSNRTTFVTTYVVLEYVKP